MSFGGWTVENGPKLINAKRTTRLTMMARATHFWARPGDRLERMKCCSAKAAVSVLNIAAARTCNHQRRIDAIGCYAVNRGASESLTAASNSWLRNGFVKTRRLWETSAGIRSSRSG